MKANEAAAVAGIVRKRTLMPTLSAYKYISGIRSQFRLLEKKYTRLCTETDMARFDWLLFT